ncbi:hypothetical protein ROE7235_03779 [Roseibaca ekhonensis]|jgi:hypothetical protein|uniref:Uncharacterized protein n=2 Tax=Roseinatronobacter ekhonensis TaxID=254356 RepID=A0A3B0MKC5_9RHOB|nr:hypothetical protein ROE7235_03779 [Roseibaca ekhonensis]
MTELTRSSVFKPSAPRAETPMDKTTRAAREILDGEMERRQVKTARLRKARLEREASPAVEVVAPSTSKVRNKPPAKAIP